jgi:hypothetical protein
MLLLPEEDQYYCCCHYFLPPLVVVVDNAMLVVVVVPATYYYPLLMILPYLHYFCDSFAMVDHTDETCWHEDGGRDDDDTCDVDVADHRDGSAWMLRMAFVVSEELGYVLVGVVGP